MHDNQLQENIDENLEELWLHDEKNISPPLTVTQLPLSDDQFITAMQEQDLIILDSENVSLTANGRLAAQNIVRRHRLSERLFSDLFGVKGDIHSRACRMEHLLTEGVEDNVCTLLGHPRTCAHGRPIPEGECCRSAREEGLKRVMTLSELPVGMAARIIYVLSGEAKEINKIISMGIEPGVTISLERRLPSYIFLLGNSRFAVDETIAKSIFVLPQENGAG